MTGLIAWIWWLLLLFSPAGMHKYYVSVTVIHYNDQNRHLEMDLHTFPDDVALALQKNYGYEINWDKPGPKARKYLNTYVHTHFRLETGGKEIPYQYLGFIFQNDQLVLLMETGALAEPPSSLSVYDTWLTEIYRDQQNLVHLLYGKTKQSAILDRQNSKSEFNLTH